MGSVHRAAAHLTHMTAPARPRQAVGHVPVDRLVEHPANIREDLGDLTEMAASIREHGILQPLTATETSDGRLLLLAGHRRLAAARLVGLPSVPVVVRSGVTKADDQIVLMLVENTQRRNLNPIERAEAYGALRNHGLSVTEISRRCGTSQATVSYYLNLLMLGDEERDAVRQGDMPVTTAIGFVRQAKAEQRAKTEQRPVGRPKGRKTTPHFGDKHPLASEARRRCKHVGRPKVGAVACGPCWEETIRIDAGQVAPTAIPVQETETKFDPVTVEAILGGSYKMRCTPADKAEVARRWYAAGRSLAQLGRLTGWKGDRYFKVSDQASTGVVVEHKKAS